MTNTVQPRLNRPDRGADRRRRRDCNGHRRHQPVEHLQYRRHQVIEPTCDASFLSTEEDGSLLCSVTRPNPVSYRRPRHPRKGVMSIRARCVWPIISCIKGATAIEYAFIASLISIAIYTAASTIGTNLTNVFSTVASSF